jgi:threonine dehydratase
MVTLAAITEAALLLRGKIIRTPLVYSPTFSAMTGAEVFLKLETMQKAGSFKVRGATNRILSKRSEIGKNGVIAASAGNHAQGVAVAAGIARVPATIVMPVWVSPSKQEATAGYGATIILEGSSLQGSIEYAMALAESGDMTFIHPYDDEAVITGQGTIGLEILEDLPDVDVVIAPVGGGGLIAGIATALKESRPAVRIIGVQASVCPSAVDALRAGEPVTIESEPTVADGIRVTRTGVHTFPVIHDLIEEVVLVDDDEIVSAILALLERKKVLAEGAGAAPLAALLSGKVPYREGEKIVLVIGGGNVDAFLFEKILRKGLFEAGRIMQCIVELPEGAGSLSALLTLLAREGGVITRVEQERGSADLPLLIVRVALELEVRSRDHQEWILSALREEGYEVIPIRVPHYSFFEFYHTIGG